MAIGTRLAESLGVTIGGNLTLVSPRGNVTPLGMTPRIKAYPVVAIFEIGMSEYDSTFVFLPFEEAQIYFNLEDEASAIEVYLANADTVDVLRTADRAGRRAPDPHQRLAGAEPHLLLRARGRTQRHVLHPDADRPGRGAQHHLRPDHAGEGQGPRHRNPAHHGRDARRHPARLLHCGRFDRHGRHACRLRSRRGRLPQHRTDPAIHLADHRHRDLLARALFPEPAARPTWTCARRGR